VIESRTNELKRKRFVLIRQLVAYFPCLIVVTLFLWPNTMLQMCFREFPVVEILGFGIRLTEIFLFILFSLVVFLSIGKNPSRGPSLIFSKQVRSMYPYLFVGLGFLAFAFIQGYFYGNPIILLDLRGMFYIAFVPVFIFFVRSLDQLRKPFAVFYILLVILSLSNLLSLKYSFYGMAGRYSNLTVMMSLYLLCLSISFYVYSSKNRRLFFGVAILVLLSCLASIQKQAYLGCLVSILGGMLLVDRNNRIEGVKLGFVLAAFLILFGVALAKWNLHEFFFHKSFEDYLYDRILRVDIGDISSGRFSMWRQIVSDTIRSPFIGKGLGPAGFDFKTMSILVHEHNIIMWSLRRFSVIGTMAFIILGIKFYTFALSVYKKEQNPFNKALLHASLTYCLVYLYINLVIILQFVFETAIIFWLNVSIVFLVHREQLAKQSIQSKCRLEKCLGIIGLKQSITGSTEA